jgi:hypothetical protein
MTETAPSRKGAAPKARANPAPTNRKDRVDPRRPTRLLVFAVCAIVVLAAVGIAVVANSGGADKTAETITSAEASAIVATISTVPSAVLDQVGAGSVQSQPTPVNGTAITVDGKPEVLYIGAEYCPFCGAERWPLFIALSRFGTFDNVGVTHSSSIDVFPNTPTLSFHGSSYASDYLAFTPVEVATNQPDGSGGYTKLDTPTAAQRAAVAELSAGGGIPFIDFGGRFLISGATYDTGVLQGHTAAEIADALSSPDSDIAKAVLAAANSITAALCQLSGNQPTSVCA